MKVPRLKSARFADGWKSRVVFIADSKDVRSWSVFTAPNGVELTPCFPREKPVLVARSKYDGIARIGLTRWEGSAAQRRWKKAQRIANAPRRRKA